MDEEDDYDGRKRIRAAIRALHNKKKEKKIADRGKFSNFSNNFTSNTSFSKISGFIRKPDIGFQNLATI